MDRCAAIRAAVGAKQGGKGRVGAGPSVRKLHQVVHAGTHFVNRRSPVRARASAQRIRPENAPFRVATDRLQRSLCPMLCPCGSENRVERGCRLALHRRRDVAVDIQRDARVHACFEQQRRGRVAQVVERIGGRPVRAGSARKTCAIGIVRREAQSRLTDLPAARRAGERPRDPDRTAFEITGVASRVAIPGTPLGELATPRPVASALSCNRAENLQWR